MSDDFYKSLKGFNEFRALTDMAHYIEAPADWHVVATDIMGSTQAIAEGRYKEVNLIGAAAIMAIMNVADGRDLPYAFGGDGATILVPPGMVDTVLSTLGAVRAKVKSMFSLDLRAGCVPIAALYEKNTWLKVAKFNLSPSIGQAVFQGTALSLAEEWLKLGNDTVRRCPDSTDDANLEGLECRWQPIENRNGVMLSVLVRVRSAYAADAWRIYGDVLRDIEIIYPDYASSRPTYEAGLRMSFSPAALSKELKLRAGKSAIARLKYFANMLIENATGVFCIKTKSRAGGFDGGSYLSDLVANSDARKFDEMLRMVIDSTPEQHKTLERMLEGRRKKGEIAYGIHQSAQALMTCLVFSYQGNHVHFIDGADGGYALAAQQMKQQR